jgi:hypothetical protein
MFVNDRYLYSEGSRHTVRQVVLSSLTGIGGRDAAQKH